MPPHPTHTAQGLAEREKLASTSEQQVAAWTKEHGDLATPLTAQEDRVAVLLVKKEAAESAEREASQKASTVGEAAPADGAAGDATPPPAGDDAVPADETDEERGRRIARQWTNDVRCATLLPCIRPPPL